VEQRDGGWQMADGKGSDSSAIRHPQSAIRISPLQRFVVEEELESYQS
jgi:hypothetical protein